MYAVPYVLLIIIFGGLAFYGQTQDKSAKKLMALGAMALLFLFFGFRGFICDDWQIYYPGFKEVEADDITFAVYGIGKGLDWHMEPGFTLLMYLCKCIFNDYFFFQAVCSLINVALLNNFLRNRIDDIPFGIVLFICFGGYGMMTNMMRNSIAILIFANAITYIEQRKPLPYFALILVAFTFHTTALIYFPLYFFAHFKLNKWIYLGIFIALNVIFLAHISIIGNIISMVIGDGDSRVSGMTDAYTSGDLAEAKGISIGYLERVLTGSLIFCYYDKLIAMRKENKIFINLFVMYLLATFILADFQVLSERMGNLFIVSYWILWSDLTHAFSISNNRRLFIAFITLYCIMKMVGLTNLVTSEYDNVLFGAKSYEQRLYIHNRTGDK